MDDLLKEITTIEQDQKQLENIEQLEKALNKVKAGYTQDYNQKLLHTIEQFKSQLKNNQKIRETVDKFVHDYVFPEKRAEARDFLYGILSAEMIQTLQALNHTSCNIM